jgi:hypothetical protein
MIVTAVALTAAGAPTIGAIAGATMTTTAGKIAIAARAGVGVSTAGALGSTTDHPPDPTDRVGRAGAETTAAAAATEAGAEASTAGALVIATEAGAAATTTTSWLFLRCQTTCRRVPRCLHSVINRML